MSNGRELRKGVMSKTLDYLKRFIGVTVAGGGEEELIKCLAPSYSGAFESDGTQPRHDGLNRAGNIWIPTNNYCLFEDWLMPIVLVGTLDVNR
ncbi:unnamed protein product [Anisakis simplex]|uniref:Probable deoxyhypusine synthase (inferred by orthology to a C. elegans protein) n=1 Tax=Anisakis simplex TaxID=6269 RepID=A0A0M3JGK1_ANISI|nr:unnamed protein product [Anisakis simplex]